MSMSFISFGEGATGASDVLEAPQHLLLVDYAVMQPVGDVLA
jgi:hypothetical protein